MKEFLDAAKDAVLDTIADDNVHALQAAAVGAKAATAHHLGHAAEGIAVLTNILSDNSDSPSGHMPEGADDDNR